MKLNDALIVSLRVEYATEMKHAGRFGPPAINFCRIFVAHATRLYEREPGEPFDSSRPGSNAPHRSVSALNPSHPLGDDLNHI